MVRLSALVLFAVFPVTGVPVGADSPGKQPNPADLRGLWLVRTAAAGEKTPQPSGGEWEIGGDKITLYRSDRVLDGRAAYKLDAAKKPGQIDIVMDGGPAEGKVLKGIYELKGDTLRVCHVIVTGDDPEKAARPREFAGGAGVVVWTFERKKPQ